MSRQTPPSQTNTPEPGMLFRTVVQGEPPLELASDSLQAGAMVEHHAITAWLRGEPLCPSCSVIVEDALQRNRDAILRDAYAAHVVAPAMEALS